MEAAGIVVEDREDTAKSAANRTCGWKNCAMRNEINGFAYAGDAVLPDALTIALFDLDLLLLFFLAASRLAFRSCTYLLRLTSFNDCLIC